MAKEKENKLLNWEILGSTLLMNEQTLDASTVFDCTKDAHAYPMRPYFSRTHLKGKGSFLVYASRQSTNTVKNFTRGFYL